MNLLINILISSIQEKICEDYKPISAEMVEQIKELESQGLDGINFIAPLEQQYRLIEDFAYNVISKM